MPLPKPNIEHIMAYVPLDGDIKDLQSKFKAWETADGRGKASVWTLLGKAYELGCAIAENGQSVRDLVNRVSEVSDVRRSNQWDPTTKKPFDLLLVLLLGLKEKTKATKSQWLRTLKAAQTSKVVATQVDFVDWIKNTGGIDGVLKPSQRPAQERKTISQLAEGLEPEFDFNGKAITIPKSSVNFQNDELPEGFALVLVRESDEEGKIWPLATITDEKQIAAAIKSFHANHKRQELAAMRGFEEEKKSAVQEVRRAARKKFNAEKKAKRYQGMFDDFLEEFIAEIDHNGLSHLAHLL